MPMTALKPVLFVKQNCPFCMKVQILLLEAGLSDQVETRVFTPGTDEETSIRATLAPHFDKVTFPTLQTDPNSFLGDSDAIVGHLAGLAGIDTAELPVFTAYADGVLQQLLELYSANIKLREQIAA